MGAMTSYPAIETCHLHSNGCDYNMDDFNNLQILKIVINCVAHACTIKVEMTNFNQ